MQRGHLWRNEWFGKKQLKLKLYQSCIKKRRNSTTVKKMTVTTLNHSFSTRRKDKAEENSQLQ